MVRDLVISSTIRVQLAYRTRQNPDRLTHGEDLAATELLIRFPGDCRAVNTLDRQQDSTGLIGRLRQVLGPFSTYARPFAGFSASNAEHMPGLYFQVAQNGAILSVSRALAETLGAGEPANLRGLPIATYLPALARGGLLNR
jgi:hypothetical protein